MSLRATFDLLAALLFLISDLGEDLFGENWEKVFGKLLTIAMD